MSLPRLFLAAVLALHVQSATAHEFWIEPQNFQVESGGMLIANLKNGQAFQGSDLAYFSTSTTRFDVIANGRMTPVEGRMGDRPALSTQATEDGLVVIVHETTPSRLKYATWEKFQKFVDHKDFKDIDARHAALGAPREGFRESYTRHTKALVAVGDGAGADAVFGLKTEFVARTNPYASDFDGTMSVALYLDGAPRADAQVEVFDRDPDGAVTITLHRTNAQGVADIAVTKGHDYLFDAVHLRPYTGEKDAVWETLWAALTFSVPQ